MTEMEYVSFFPVLTNPYYPVLSAESIQKSNFRVL